MKKNKPLKKLNLDRETITVLQPEGLDNVNGGAAQASLLTLGVTYLVGNNTACRIIC